jgi:hypothetical protein
MRNDTSGIGACAEGADGVVGICSLNNTLSICRSRVALLLVYNMTDLQSTSIRAAYSGELLHFIRL